MKNIVIATLIATAALSASAVEIGLTTAHADVNERNSTGITVGQSFGKIGVTAGFERTTTGVTQDRYSLVGSYNVASLGSVAVAAKVGGAYLNNAKGADGYALTVGVGASLPVTQHASVGVDVSRQYGQERVEAFNGTRVAAGVKYTF